MFFEECFFAQERLLLKCETFERDFGSIVISVEILVEEEVCSVMFICSTGLRRMVRHMSTSGESLQTACLGSSMRR